MSLGGTLGGVVWPAIIALILEGCFQHIVRVKNLSKKVQPNSFWDTQPKALVFKQWSRRRLWLQSHPFSRCFDANKPRCLQERCGSTSTRCLGVAAKWNIVCYQNGVVPGWLGIYVRCKPCTIGSSSNVDAPPFDSRFLQLRCTNGFRVTHQAEACSMNQSCTAENPKRIQALQEDPPSRTNAKRLKKFTKMKKNSKRDKCATEAKEELKRRSRWKSQDILSHRFFQLWNVLV